MKKNEIDKKVMLINQGDYSLLASFDKGETVIIGDPSTCVYSGVTVKENDKTLSLVKKISEKIKRK